MTNIAQCITERFVDQRLARKAAFCLAVTQASLGQSYTLYTYADGSVLQVGNTSLIPVPYLLDMQSGQVDTEANWRRNQGKDAVDRRKPWRQLVPASMDGYGKWGPEVYRRFVCFDPLHGVRDVTIADIPIGASLRIDQAFYDAALKPDWGNTGVAWGIWGLVDRQVLERGFRNGHPVPIATSAPE